MADWPDTSYPTSIDSYPALVDGVDTVDNSHPNALASAVEAIETKLGVDGDPIQGTGGICFDPTGKLVSPAPAGVPTFWFYKNGAIEYLFFTDSNSIDYNLLIKSGPWIDNIETVHAEDSPYSVLAGDQLINCDTSSSPIEVVLPAGVLNKWYVVKDAAGNAENNSITIRSAIGELIDNDINYVFSQNSLCAFLFFDGTSWVVVSRISADSVADLDPIVLPKTSLELKNYLEDSNNYIVVLDDYAYNIDTVITISLAEKRIWGTGKNSALTFMGSGSIVIEQSCDFRNLKINNFGASTASSFLEVNVSDGVTNIENCHIEFNDELPFMLYFYNCSPLTVSGCYFSSDSSAIGFYSDSCSRVNLLNNKVYNTDMLVFYYVDTCDSVVISGNDFVSVDGTDGNVECYIDNSSNISIRNNNYDFNNRGAVATCDLNAFEIYGSSYIDISGNTFSRVSDPAAFPNNHIVKVSGCTDISIKNNNAFVEDAELGTGLFYFGGISRAIISDNCFVGDNCKNILYFYSECNDVLVSGNLFSGFLNNGIYIIDEPEAFVYSSNILVYFNSFVTSEAGAFGVSSAAVAFDATGCTIEKNNFVGSFTYITYATFANSYCDIPRARELSSDTTLDYHDYVILVDASAANVTITLPDNTKITNGKKYIIKRIDNTGNTCKVTTGDAGVYIDGMVDMYLNNRWDSLTIIKTDSSATEKWGLM
jgi:hypothetical protein